MCREKDSVGKFVRLECAVIYTKSGLRDSVILIAFHETRTSESKNVTHVPAQTVI